VARVNLLKQIKIDDRWVLRSIPKKPNGQRDWNALPDGSYFIEWRENSKRRRLPAGTTVAQALEVQRRKHAELGALASGIIAPRLQTEDVKKAPLQALIDRYLDQIQTLKKPNTFRKYDAVLKRFAKDFVGQTLDTISVEDLNDFVVKLKKGGMSPNTVLHNVIIIAQFFRRNGRPGITRLLQLPERISPLPREYTQEELAKFLTACDEWERALFSTFLLTGFREQEVMYLFWNDVNLALRTIRVTSKPDLGFFPKRWEERKVPVPVRLADIIKGHPQTNGSTFMFPSPTGKREQNMLLRCKAVAERAGLDPAEFDLKTFRSTYATRMLRKGFDVRTVQDWMGHKSLETTMRYLVPATDVHDRLDEIDLPGDAKPLVPKKAPGSERIRPTVRRKLRS
jgi:integrase/recombinase XerD